jgi:uncharacterized membrane protein YkoI
MLNVKAILLALAIAAVSGPQALAADAPHCLSPDARRAAIANHMAVPLSRAVRVAKTRVAGEVVRARLCESDHGLVYMLTVLSRSGKVTRASVDALSGQLVGSK